MVSDGLGHHAVGRQLTADNAGEVLDALFAVIQQEKATRNSALVAFTRVFAAASRFVGRVQRPDTPVRAGDFAALKGGHHVSTLVEHFLDFPLFFVVVVWVVDSHTRRPQDDLAVVGDDDIAVVGNPTPVDNGFEPLVVDADHYAFGWFHFDVEASHRRALAGPRAGCVDDVVGFDGFVELAADLDGRNRAIADRYSLDRSVRKDICAMFFGTGCVSCDEP